MKDKLVLCVLSGFIFFALLAGLVWGEKVIRIEQDSHFDIQQSRTSNLITMFMCGDVMTGRGIDQVLPHPGNPLIHESYVRNATRYVELAERANAPIPKPVSFSYPGEILWRN